MKKLHRRMLALVLAGLAAGCLEKPSTSPGTASTVLYRHYFLGTAHLAKSTNAARIPSVLALPATHEFGQQLLQKLSQNPETLWRKFLPPGATTSSALVRPLLDDLVSAESYAEIHGPLHRSEAVFAIELSEQRAGLWRTNLALILAGWKLGTANPLSDGKG